MQQSKNKRFISKRKELLSLFNNLLGTTLTENKNTTTSTTNNNNNNNVNENENENENEKKNENKNKNLIKELNDDLDKIIDKTKSCKEQIKLLRKIKK